MISDILVKAITEIDEYLATTDIYNEPTIFHWVTSARDQMMALRTFLDTPPPQHDAVAKERLEEIKATTVWIGAHEMAKKTRARLGEVDT